MRRMSIYCLSLAMLYLCLCGTARGQGLDKQANQAASTAAAAPASGARAEFLAEVAYYEQRFTRLAQAMPAEKYTWRPAEGVRSIGEVYNHIVAAKIGEPNSLPAIVGERELERRRDVRNRIRISRRHGQAPRPASVVW